jgi:NADH-quinone oxidoreductase subunit M
MREIGYFIPLLVFIIWIGVYPNTFLKKTEATTAHFVAKMAKAKEGAKLTLSHLGKGEAR